MAAKTPTPGENEHVPAVVTEETSETPTIINIDTPAFSAEALSINELPGVTVAYAMAAHGPQQTVALLELFRLAILEPKKAEDIDVLSFGQMAEAMSDWMDKSINTSQSDEDDSAVRQ